MADGLWQTACRAECTTVWRMEDARRHRFHLTSAETWSAPHYVPRFPAPSHFRPSLVVMIQRRVSDAVQRMSMLQYHSSAAWLHSPVAARKPHCPDDLMLSALLARTSFRLPSCPSWHPTTETLSHRAASHGAEEMAISGWPDRGACSRDVQTAIRTSATGIAAPPSSLGD